ncbi:MAG: radical SAM protein [Candidatus Omnitrophica bacterium]|nr:radical SAM protein [Candidatus Omnitrophota bacterium]MDE2223394.1 radical SAM protein [Candidatus Omnitrophota bacterium]
MHVSQTVQAARLFLKYPAFMRHLAAYKVQSYKRYCWTLKNPDKDGRVPPPLIYKLTLNQACDLRCPMCFLWGEEGVYTSEDKKPVPHELDWQLAQKVILEAERTGKHHSFILSGGEALLYSRFKDLANLLKERRAFTSIITNGGGIGKHLDVIEDNPYLSFYVSLDGTKEVNEVLRGKGVYEKVTNNIKRLKAFRRPPYVAILFTLQPENVGVLYETCRELVNIGVDRVLINLRWNLSKAQGDAYERQLQEDFGARAWTHKGYITPSYPVSTREFITQYEKIKKARWAVHISSYLRKPEDLDVYINEGHRNPYNNFCYKQWLRMDVLTDGQVTPCYPYPDLKFDNLADKSIDQIWNGEPYKRFRQYIRKKSLPVCSKCCALYLYDKNRMML